jgi:competence protein ComEC
MIAGAVAAGALAARPMTLLFPLAVGCIALAARRPLLLALAGMVAASALGARAEAGLAVRQAGPVAGEVTLVSDPVSRWGQVEAVARLDGKLVLVRAGAPAAEVVAARLAGERIHVTGSRRPLGRGAERWRVRHVGARVEVRSARAGGDAASPWRAANHLRRLLAHGSEPLGDEQRSLLLGLVLGDDRDQSPEMTDDFRASGLAHLLAVSGQNVAFVLAGAAPLLHRLGLAGRTVGIVLLLAAFATVTRFEPSVLRAVVMAGIAAVAACRGTPVGGVHVLALAVSGLVLVDPFLVRSTGFHLSVAATAGILLLSSRVMNVLPGPAPVVLPVAVTVSAQIAVAPLLIGTFGGVPVVSLAANVLAAPAAAMAMMWGLPLGLVAGLAGPSAASWLHLPTSAALGWLAAVARTAASVPLGELRWAHLAIIATALAAIVARRAVGATGRVVPAAAVGAAVVALLAPGLALHRAPLHAQPTEGLDVWRSDGATVVVIAPGTGPAATLQGLRRAGVTQVDLLVVGPGGTATDEERAARHRSRVRRAHHVGRDPDTDVRVGGLRVRLSSAGTSVGTS